MMVSKQESGDEPVDYQFIGVDPDKDHCVVCGETSNVHSYDGENYCEEHLQQKLAMQ